MYRNILFDFDGTLIDSNDIIVSALNETARQFTGDSLSHEALQAILGKPLAIQMQAIDPTQWEAMDAYYRQYYRAHRDAQTKTFEGVEQMLKTLHEAGCKMGIVSNKGASGIQHGLAKFKLDSYFDTVVSSDDVTHKKPHTECVDKALSEMGGNAADTLLIGDSIHDIECGKNAGIHTVLVGWTIIDRHRILHMGPDYVVETPEEIVNLVLKR